MVPPTSRRSGFSRKAQYSVFTGYLLAAIGVVAGGLLLLLTLNGSNLFSGLRGTATDVAAPVGKAGANGRVGVQGFFGSLIGYFNAGSQNAKLREEVEIARIRLKEAEAVKAENRRLKELLQLGQVALLLRSRQRDAARPALEPVHEHVGVRAALIRVHIVIASPDPQELVDEVLREVGMTSGQGLDVGERFSFLLDFQEELSEDLRKLRLDRVIGESEPVVSGPDIEDIVRRDRARHVVAVVVASVVVEVVAVDVALQRGTAAG